jgi:hypothetical protein
VRPPPAGVEHAGEPAARSITAGAAPFTAIAADCVLTETYRGPRAADDPLVRATGILMFKLMLCMAAACCGARGRDETAEPPPAHPETATHETSPTNQR